MSDVVQSRRISALTRTATAADLMAGEYMVVDKANGYTRKVTLYDLALWVLSSAGQFAAAADIAPEFVTGMAYSKGAFVYNGGTLYCASVNVPGGGWDETMWEAAAIGPKLAALESYVETELAGIETLLAAI